MKNRSSSIEVASRSSDSEISNNDKPRARNPKLGPTFAVIGKFECPERIKGNQPDMAMVSQARELLGYKTNITVLEWWALFPSRRWWSYALTATRYLAKSRNYKYFLKCLVTAATQGAKLKQFSQLLQKVTGRVAENLVQGEKPAPVACPSGCGSICEVCHPLKLQYERDLTEWNNRRIGGNAYSACLD